MNAFVHFTTTNEQSNSNYSLFINITKRNIWEKMRSFHCLTLSVFRITWLLLLLWNISSGNLSMRLSSFDSNPIDDIRLLSLNLLFLWTSFIRKTSTLVIWSLKTSWLIRWTSYPHWFRSSKEFSDSNTTKSFGGSIFYLKSENLIGVDYGVVVEVDFWTLGVLAYELYSKIIPFYFISSQIFREKFESHSVDFSGYFPSNLKDLFRGLLARDP